MRMYRILTFFLIAGFVLSTSACSYKRVKTVPDPKVNYTIEIEEGDVQLVVPCGKGFIYTTDLNELVIVDENGDAIGHHSFDNTIIDVYSDGNGIIMIALDNAEVLNCSFDNNDVE